jgi:hypothetical protein
MDIVPVGAPTIGCSGARQRAGIAAGSRVESAARRLCRWLGISAPVRMLKEQGCTIGSA